MYVNKRVMSIIIFLMLHLVLFTSLISIQNTVQNIDKKEGIPEVLENNKGSRDYPPDNVSINETLIFSGEDMLYLPLPMNSTISSAKMSLSGENASGYPCDVFVDVSANESAEWGYSGLGYGSFGMQNEFFDNSTLKEYDMDAWESRVTNIILPKNASIINSSLVVEGKGIEKNSSILHTMDGDFNGIKENVTVQGNGVSLDVYSYDWTQTSTADFAYGNYTNVNISSDEIKLATKADWMNENWLYRQEIKIVNTGAALTNYQVKLTLDTQSLISAGQMRSDCGDMRFTSSDGFTQLSYWIESGINTASTIVWVKVPSLPASTSTKIYMYYGNPSAISASNGASTFLLFDDFSDGDASDWTNYGLGSVTIVNDNGNYALLKTGYDDPNGGYKLFSSTTSSFEAVFKTKRVNEIGGTQNRYGFEDSSFNGYGPRMLDFNSLPSQFAIERRTGGGGSDIISKTTSAYEFNAWMTVKFRYYSGNIVFELYNSTGVLVESITGTDATYSQFDRMVIHGGREYYTDDIIVRNYVQQEPTFSLGIVEGKYVSTGRFYSGISGNFTQASAYFGNITFDVTSGAGTMIEVLTRTGNSTNPEDGSWSEWTVCSSGEEIQNNTARYVQYCVLLLTTIADTPVLRSISFECFRYYDSGIYQSDVIPFLESERICRANVTWNTSVSSGLGSASLEVCVSNDGGISWQNVNNGEEISFNEGGVSNRLCYRVSFFSDGFSFLILEDIYLSCNLKCYPSNITLDFGLDGLSSNKVSSVLFTNVTLDISSDISESISTGNCIFFTDLYGNEMCMIPLNITTESDGRICIHNLSIEYNFEAWVCGTRLKNSLQGYIDNRTNPDWIDENGTWYVSVPILITNLGSGCINIKIEVFYDLPPKYTEIPIVRVPEDSFVEDALNLSNYFYDDHDTNYLTFSILEEENSSLVRSVLNGSMLSFYAMKENWVGSVNITVAAYDRYHKCAKANITIIVDAVNDAPNITIPSELFGLENVLFTLDLLHDAGCSLYDVDNDTSELRLYTNVSEGFVIVKGEVISFNYTSSGIYYVRVFVTDGILTSYAEVKIIISNLPPIMIPFDDIYIYSNETYVLDLYDHATDPEGEPITWSYSITGTQVNELANVSLVYDVLYIEPFACSNGNFSIILNASDAHGNTVSTFVNVTIINVCIENLPPVIFGLDDVYMLSNETWTIDLSMHGIDPDGDNLTWEVLENSELFSIFRLGNVMTILPSQCANGSAKLFFRLTDEHGYFAVSNITINITPSCVENSAPVILPGLEQINLTKVLFTLDLSPFGYDPDGDLLTWYAEGQSNLFSWSLEGSKLYLMPKSCVNGSGKITLILKDDNNNSVLREVTVFVNNDCPIHIPPSIKQIPDVTIEKEPISISLEEYWILGTDLAPTWSITYFDTKFIDCVIVNNTLTITRKTNETSRTFVELRLKDFAGEVANAKFNVTLHMLGKADIVEKVDNFSCVLAWVLALVVLIACILILIYAWKRMRSTKRVNLIILDEPTKEKTQEKGLVQSENVTKSQNMQTYPAKRIQTELQPTVVTQKSEAIPICDSALIAEKDVPVAKSVDEPKETPSQIEEPSQTEKATKEGIVARPVATAVAVESDEEVAVAKPVWKAKPTKGKTSVDYGAAYEVLLKKVKSAKANAHLDKNENERLDGLLRLAENYHKAGNDKKANEMLTNAEKLLAKQSK